MDKTVSIQQCFLLLKKQQYFITEYGLIMWYYKMIISVLH